MKKFLAAAVALGALAATPAWAGVYGDDVTRCLVKSTTEEDQMTLVKWIFAGIAAHPAIKQYSSITPAQKADLDIQAGVIVMKLLTQSCRKETVLAMKYEGSGFAGKSFGALGQIAMAGLTTNPEVASALTQWTHTVDMKALADLAAEAGRTAPTPPAQ